MGIKFKPSQNHKVQSGHNYFNITESELVANAQHKVECQWPGGVAPRWSKTRAKLEKDLEENDEPSPTVIERKSQMHQLKDIRAYSPDKEHLKRSPKSKRSRSGAKNAKDKDQKFEIKLQKDYSAIGIDSDSSRQDQSEKLNREISSSEMMVLSESRRKMKR